MAHILAFESNVNLHFAFKELFENWGLQSDIFGRLSAAAVLHTMKGAEINGVPTA